MKNTEENSEKIGKIQKKGKLKRENILKMWKKKVKWYGKYGRKVIWNVNWFGKYRGKYGRKVIWNVNWFGKYRGK